jgi:hypothetical protein
MYVSTLSGAGYLGYVRISAKGCTLIAIKSLCSHGKEAALLRGG